ncbi:MAG: glycosyltransferase [Bacteroidales bacterium]|nr:glycosyltransferase [Bacteroidales bacterium]
MKNKKEPYNFHSSDSDNLPTVSILMSLYNEEAVIEEKIKSVFSSEYPSEKLELIIGSDNSDDNTNNIVEKYSEKHKNLFFTIFKERQGKPSIINQLQKKATGNILIITDANVIFSKNTIFEMVKYYKDKSIGLVDSQMRNTKESISNTGISIPESNYISGEVKIKQNESILFGTMMGPFGGCYSIRAGLYKPVPSNFLVDDFYICMNILKQGRKAVNCKQAVVYEDVSNDLKEEFRRKIRISTGNFQNLIAYRKLLFSSMKGLSFCFFSHKVLRWFGPFFILSALIANIFLLNFNIYIVSIYLITITFAVLFIDLILKRLKIHLPVLRYITHFYSMNAALLIGFLKYLTGVKSGIWQPTKRNQLNN